jgi:hypothetical protein
MAAVQWQQQANGTFTAESCGFQLRVHDPLDRPFALFVVLMPQRPGVETIVGSGSMIRVDNAMAAAEGLAERLRHSGVPT